VTDGVGIGISQSKNASIANTLQSFVGDGVGVGQIELVKKLDDKFGTAL
jgi:hypothetical protein